MIPVGARTWTGDGSSTTDWESVTDDVQAVFVYFPDGTKRVHMSDDFYYKFKRPDGTFDWDSGGDLEKIMAEHPDAVVKRGKWMETYESFRALMEVAHRTPWGE